MANAPDIDDLDTILRERQEARRETNTAGLRGTVLGMNGLAGINLSSLPNESSTTIPVDKQEEEFDDEFADFDFEAPAKPAPVPPVFRNTETAKALTEEAIVTQNTKEISGASPFPDNPISNSAPFVQQTTISTTPQTITPNTVAPSPPSVATQQNKAEDVVEVDYVNYDPFDDFEYDAKKPKKTVIMDPKHMKEFQSMDQSRKSEVSYSSGQEKSGNSDGQSKSRNQSGMGGEIPTLAQLALESTSRISAPPQKIDEETLKDEHEELLFQGRERSINTIAAGPSLSRPALPANFKLDTSLENSSNLRIIDSIVSKTKTNKLQDEAFRQELESKDLKELITQDLSDISLSDQEIEETSVQTSPTRDSLKPKGMTDPVSGESGVTRSKEAKLRQKLEDLKKKANDKSKMHSIFLSKPQEEFERMAFTYHEEINKIKESTGKLKIDLDSINADMNRTPLAEISVDNLRPNFFEFFSGKYGVPKIIIPDKTAANFIVGTDKGLLVVFDQKQLENYATLQLSTVTEDYPVSIFPDWDNDQLWIGMNKGDVWLVKHSSTDNSLRKVAYAKEFSPSAEILDLVVSKNREHLVAVDGEYRVLYCKLDKSKPLDKIRIASTQIFFTKRDVLPHLDMKEVAPDVYLCVVSAGVQVTIFEFKAEVKNLKAPTYTKMLEMDLDHSANLDSSILLPLYPVGHELKKTESSSGTASDPNLVTLADEKGDGDTIRKGRRVSETNESYPLLIRFADDPNRSLVLAVAFKRTFYIFDLHPTPERTFRAQSLSEVRIRARAVSVSFFSAGKIILMDIFNDFYLIDVTLGIQYSEAQSLLLKQAQAPSADVGRILVSLGTSAVIQPKNAPTRTTSLRTTSLTNSINKTREFLSSLNGHKTPSNVNGTLFVDSTQEFDQSCVFLIYPYGNVEQILSTQTRTRSLTSYSNLITKSLGGEFFFVNQKGLIKLGVMNWKQYLDTCLAAGNYYKALKTINELLDGEFETLRRPPPKRQLPGELAPYIRRVVEEFVEELKMAPPEEIEIFMNYCMMTLIKNSMQDYITDELESIMDNHELIGYFWRSLVLLFRSQLIPNLEFEKVMRIVAYLEQDPLEKQRFILYLFNRKLYREMLFNNLANRGNLNLLFFLSSKVDESHKSTFALEYIKDSIEIHGEDAEKRSKFYFQMFWYVSEFVEKKLQKKEVKYQDHSWYILNWFFNPSLIAFLVQKDLKAFLEGWFLLFENKFPQLMAFNNGLDLLQDYKIPINEIVNLKKTSLEMVALMSCIFSSVKDNPQDLNYFYFWIAIVKFHKVPCIELNDNTLKELVLTLIRNINQIVSDPRLDITHEDLNILIFATFTEHKEIFVDNSELRDLIMKNEKSLRLLYHEMNRDISATFSLYRKLSRDNVQFKFRMFQWLKKGIEIKGEKEEIMSLIKNEFGFLLAEDVSCLCDLIAAMKLEDQMKAVLTDYVDSQNLLLVFDSIMDNVKNNSMENYLTDPFKIRYLSLLLQFDRKRVMDQLKYGKYPLNESLNLCEKKYKHELATAFLKDGLGSSSESLEIYKNRLKKHITFLTSKKMQMLGPKADKLRWKMMDKLNDEIDIAINLCKKGSDDMLSEYLNFMVSFTDKKLYIDQKDPLKALLISKSKLVFDTILDLTEFDKLLLTLRSDKKNITNNRFLMERLMNHFRETMRLSNVCVDINIHDWWEINENLIARKSPAVKTKMPKHNPEISHLMLYRRCKHMQPSPSSLKEERIVYCATCAMESENTQAMNNLDKFKLNVERLPLSNNLDFSSAGVGLLLTDRGAQAQANCRHSWCQLQAKPKK